MKDKELKIRSNDRNSPMTQEQYYFLRSLGSTPTEIEGFTELQAKNMIKFLLKKNIFYSDKNKI